MALGKNIRHYREGLGLTLEQLSDRSGVDVGTISALENRDSKRSQFATAIARALGMSTEQLESGQAAYPHEARLLADIGADENKRKPQFFSPQLFHIPLYAYPIVTLDELRGGVVVDRENKEFMAGRETDVCDREPGRHDFAIRTQDDSMNGGAQPIPAGTVVFIEATNEAAPGEIVLIQFGAGTPILRTLVEDGDGYQLMPAAQGMQGKALSAGFKLHGVAFSWNIRVRPVAGARQDLSL